MLVCGLCNASKMHCQKLYKPIPLAKEILGKVYVDLCIILLTLSKGATCFASITDNVTQYK